jgi:AraC-like DNA-binding protein
MTLLIDTAVVPAPQRVDFWSEESHDAYHPLEIRTDVKDRFSARMWGDELASLGVFRIATAANTMTRTPRDIAAGDPEALHVMVLVRGSLKMTQDHRAAVLGPGDMASYDTSRPTMASADQPFAGVILRIPRALLGPHAVPLSGLTAVRLPGAAGLPRLAARFFVGVAEGLAAGAIARDDANVAERVIDLIRGVYAGPGASPGAANPCSRTALLLHAQAFIEGSLSDPRLDPERIAQACFISTRYLHRVFKLEGLSVCGWVRSARLDRCRRELVDPAFANDTIADIASRWGLPSAPHFSRVFHDAYGCSPRDFRHSAQGGARPPGSA